MAQSWMTPLDPRLRQGNRQPQPQAPQADTSSFANYLQGGHLPGMGGGGGNNNGEYAAMLGNAATGQQGNSDFFSTYMKNLMGQNNVSAFKNPYQGQMNQIFSGMAGMPNTQQSADAWRQQYMPMLQQGGQMQFDNPQLRQTMLGQGAQNFMAGNSQANQYGTPGLGVGGDIATRIAQMQQPQGSGNPMIGQAANAAMSGYLGMQNQPGMTAEQMDTAARGVIDPTRRALAQKQEGDLSGLSARGLGRSTAVSKVMGENAGILGDVNAQTYGNLTRQNIDLQNQNRLAGTAGLAGLQGQFSGQDQNQQGLNQSWLMNQGNLGLNLGQAGMQGQLATNQLNQQAGNDAFNQNATRAGMGMDLYNSDANRALQELEGNRSYGLNTQGMQADNQYRNANMFNQNLMSLLGMGANAGQQDFGNRNQLYQNLLGAGNQAQNAWATNQGNRLNQYGMQGDMANSLFGNMTGQYNNDRNFYETMRQYGLNRQDQLDMQNRGGGIGGLLGGIGGTILGSALGPIGAGIGGSLGNKLFGGGQQQPQQQQSYRPYSPYAMWGG